jgi:hypothetical protein
MVKGCWTLSIAFTPWIEMTMWFLSLIQFSCHMTFIHLCSLSCYISACSMYCKQCQSKLFNYFRHCTN